MKLEDYSDREVLDKLVQESIKMGQYNYESEWNQYREQSNVINELYNEVFSRLWDRSK